MSVVTYCLQVTLTRMYTLPIYVFFDSQTFDTWPYILGNSLSPLLTFWGMWCDVFDGGQRLHIFSCSNFGNCQQLLVYFDLCTAKVSRDLLVKFWYNIETAVYRCRCALCWFTKNVDLRAHAYNNTSSPILFPTFILVFYTYLLKFKDISKKDWPKENNKT